LLSKTPSQWINIVVIFFILDVFTFSVVGPASDRCLITKLVTAAESITTIGVHVTFARFEIGVFLVVYGLTIFTHKL
jgi:hypothetical protein